MSKIEKLKSKLTWPWIVTGGLVCLLIFIMIVRYFLKGSLWGQLKAESFYQTAFDVVLKDEQFKEYVKEVSKFLQRPVEINVLTFRPGSRFRHFKWGASEIKEIDVKGPGNFFSLKSTPSFFFKNFNGKDIRKGLKTLTPIDEEEVEEIEKISDGGYLCYFIIKVKWESKALHSTFETADIISNLRVSVKRGKIDRFSQTIPSLYKPNFFDPTSLAKMQRQFDSLLVLLDNSTNILAPQNHQYFPIDLKACQYREARKLQEFFEVSQGTLIQNIIRIGSLFYLDENRRLKYNPYNAITYSLTPNNFLNLPYVFKALDSNNGNLCVLDVPVGVDGFPENDRQTIVAIDLSKGELTRRDILTINSIDLTPTLINQFMAGDFYLFDRPYINFVIGMIIFVLFALVLYLLLGIIFRIKMIFTRQR